MSTRRRQRTCDHRLVRETGDIGFVTRDGVPRSAAAGWVRREARLVVTSTAAYADNAALCVRVVRLERRLRRVEAILRMLLALVQVLQPDLARLRTPRAADKSRLLRAMDRSRDVRGLARVLRLLRLSPSRLSAWRRTAQAHKVEDAPSCPHASPQLRAGGGRAAEETVIPKRCFPNARTFTADLEAAGIAKKDDQGRVLDLHSLRGTMLTWLKDAGVHPAVAQRAARHAKIDTTIRHYTHVVDDEVRAALAQVPLLPPEEEAEE